MKLPLLMFALTFPFACQAREYYRQDALLHARNAYSEPDAYPNSGTAPDATLFSRRGADTIAQLLPRVVWPPCEITNPHHSATCTPALCGASPLVLCVRGTSADKCMAYGMGDGRVRNICGGCRCAVKASPGKRPTAPTPFRPKPGPGQGPGPRPILGAPPSPEAPTGSGEQRFGKEEV